MTTEITVMPGTEPAVPATATPASAWRKASAEGELYRLPGSGNVARLARRPLYVMAAQGGLSNSLADRLLKAFTNDRPKGERTQAEREETFREELRTRLEVAALCFVEPRLILDRPADPAKGEIGPEDLTDADVQWVYYDFNGEGAQSTAMFRLPEGHGPA